MPAYEYLDFDINNSYSSPSYTAAKTFVSNM